MITAKELNKYYKESDRIKDSKAIAEKFLKLLENELKRVANAGYSEYALEKTDGEILSDLFFNAESHNFSSFCREHSNADPHVVQRIVFNELCNAGYTSGWDGSPSRIKISWQFPNDESTL